MVLSARTEVSQKQSLAITPQLQQAIKLLQMSNIELAEYIDGELQQNPLLCKDDDEENNDSSENNDQTSTNMELQNLTDIIDDNNSTTDSIEQLDAYISNDYDVELDGDKYEIYLNSPDQYYQSYSQNYVEEFDFLDTVNTRPDS